MIEPNDYEDIDADYDWDEELEVLTPAENVNLDVIREVTRKLKYYFKSGAVGAMGQTARHYAILTYHAINEPAGYEGNGDEGAMDADIVLAVLMGMDCFEEVERGVFQLAGEEEKKDD
jgi:hypothetical protein